MKIPHVQDRPNNGISNKAHVSNHGEFDWLWWHHDSAKLTIDPNMP